MHRKIIPREGSVIERYSIIGAQYIVRRSVQYLLPRNPLGFQNIWERGIARSCLVLPGWYGTALTASPPLKIRLYFTLPITLEFIVTR